MLKIEGRVIMEMEPAPQGGANLKAVDTLLIPHPPLHPGAYFGDDELPNAIGSKALMGCYIQGLVSTIKMQHEKGFMNEADGMRYAIAEIQRSFVEVTHGEASDWNG